MAEWWRSWHGAPTDPKWVVVARRAQVEVGKVVAVWYALEDYASQHEDRGSTADFDLETVAAFFQWPEPEIAAILAALTEKRLIGKEGRLRAWDKRQPVREDNSTERTRQYRARKKASDTPKRHRKSVTRGDAKKRSVTQRDAAQRNVTPDREIERESNTKMDVNPPSSSEANGASAPDPVEKSWSTVAGETWEEVMQGTAPYGLIGSALKPLVEAHGHEEVLSLWRIYLEGYRDAGKSQFANAPHFAQRYGDVKERGGNIASSSGRERNPTLAKQRHRKPTNERVEGQWRS